MKNIGLEKSVTIEQWAEAHMTRVDKLMKVLPDHKIHNGFKPATTSNKTPEPSERREDYLKLIDKLSVGKLVENAIWCKNGE